MREIQYANACFVPTYINLGSCTHIFRQKPYLDNFELLFHLMANGRLFFIIFAFECDSNTILHLIGSLILSFHCFLIQIVNLMSSYSFLQASSLYSSRSSTNHVVEWYKALTEETRAHYYAVDFEPIICLLLERSASAILIQSLAKSWWDTTHTFHIADREITVTPYDFHRMTGLRCDGALINLEGVSST